MNFYYKLLIAAALAALVALAVLARRPARATSDSGPPDAVWLALIAGSLLVVGLVSNTLIRHLVQIVPLVGAMLLSLRRPAIGGAAAAPLFAFWLLVMIGIWLFLLGIARIFTGTFSAAEIALTLIIGAASVVGLAFSGEHESAPRYPARVATVCAFSVFQFAAMWLSTLPFAAAR